ncbi:helix-turn-helix domain-containing protein [Halococcus sp. AFM35]|uniref:helix-turn-helix domain-containing protein n=1 Tax=Halococcus sp. AFM35 TaxID=3421653 RepID=UPI003EBC5ED7
MYEATLRINHESPYATITESRDTYLEVWCNQYCDLIHMSGSDLETPTEIVNQKVGISEITYNDDEALMITDDCLLEFHDNLLEKYLKQNDCLSLPPLTYTDKTLLTRVISLTEEHLTAVYHDLSNDYQVEVEAKREIESVVPDVPLLMLDSMFPELSDRQQQSLKTAIEAGYYDIPRGTTTEEMATKLGITRRTFEEHLRRAENKIIKDVVNHLLV